MKQTQKELTNAKSTIHKLENDTLTHLSLGRQAVQSDNDNNQIYDMYQDALHKIDVSLEHNICHIQYSGLSLYPVRSTTSLQASHNITMVTVDLNFE